MRGFHALIAGVVGICLMASGPALAQDENKIIVIQKDGSRSELVIKEEGKPEVRIPETPEPARAEKPAIPQATYSPREESEADRADNPQPLKKKADPEPVKRAVKAPKAPPKPKTPPSAPVEQASIGKTYIDRIPEPTENTPITPEIAKRMAIEIAPPSRSVEVYRRTYQDRPVYQVTFKTDRGFHDILIDAENGEILKR